MCYFNRRFILHCRLDNCSLYSTINSTGVFPCPISFVQTHIRIAPQVSVKARFTVKLYPCIELHLISKQ